MNIPKDIGLQWVVVDGSLRHVSDFAEVSPQKRPLAVCPVCSRPVTLKLGKVRVHHCAHQPGDSCIATQPETVLHLNTKFHIYQQLQNARMLYTEIPCDGHSRWRCEATQRHIWQENWDTVEMEYTVSSYRPDIALLIGGKVVGAIEVLVTHAVDDEKARFFKQKNIPWIEMKAKEAFYEGKKAWTPIQPFPVFHQEPQIDPWICEECVQRDRELEQRLDYERNNYTRVHSAKMVDIYYKSGKKYREVFYVMKTVKNGEWVEAWVKIEKETIGAREYAPITKASLKNLSIIVARRLDSFKHMEVVAIVDDTMDWRLWEPGSKFHPRDTLNHPFRYEWEENTKRWLKPSQMPHKREGAETYSETIAVNGQYVRAWRKKELPQPDYSDQAEQVCMFCGQVTRNWLWFGMKKGQVMCICNECYPLEG